MANTVFGTCTWTLGMEDPAAIMTRVRELGLSAIQFHGDHKTHDPTQVREAALAGHVTLYAIDPIGCKPGPDDIADADHGIAYYRRLIDFAATAECKIITAHGLGAWCEVGDREKDFVSLARALQVLCDYAAMRGVTVLWEMCNRYELPMVRTCAEGRRLHERVARTNFALILDSFHMNIEERDAASEIRATGQNLAIYHISDSGRGGIGSGNVNFEEQFVALQSIGYDAPVMLEVVLPALAPHTPPQSFSDWEALRVEYSRSIATWHRFGHLHESAVADR